MSTQLAKLKEKLKRSAAIGGQIIEIPANQSGFRCQHSFHPAKEPVFHRFTARIKEIVCDCGTIYRKKGAQNG